MSDQHTQAQQIQNSKLSMMSIVTTVIIIITLLTLAGQWLNTRHKFNEIERSLSHKLDQYQAINQQSLALAKQAQERSTQANARTIVLEQKLAESRDQQEALQTLYTQLAESRESTAAAEVEQLLTIASQHRHTRQIQIVLFHPGFPVDIRHNAKIGREQLTAWAAKRLAKRA